MPVFYPSKSGRITQYWPTREGVNLGNDLESAQGTLGAPI